MTTTSERVVEILVQQGKYRELPQPMKIGSLSFQGWTPDFIPLVLQEALDKKYFDQRIPITGAEGIKWAKALAQKEGILTGISGSSTFAVARQVAEQAATGSVMLCVLPDTGERYLTTPLFEGIVEDMDEDEVAISKSTPGYQMT